MFRINNRLQRAGFSVVELIIVVAIISILTTIGLVSFQKAGASSRDAKRKSDLEQVRAALVLYRADTGSYPPSINWDTMSPIQSYITVTSMKDPRNVYYTYTTGTSTFSVCAVLENTTPSSYCVTNP